MASIIGAPTHVAVLLLTIDILCRTVSGSIQYSNVSVFHQMKQQLGIGANANSSALISSVVLRRLLLAYVLAIVYIQFHVSKSLRPNVANVVRYPTKPNHEHSENHDGQYEE